MPIDPVTGAALVGVAGNLLGGFFGDSASAKAAKNAARMNEMYAKKAHQWEVEDLRKAGLNPILSGTGGGGANVAAAPVAQTGNLGRGISQAATTAAQLKLIQAQTENVDADTRGKNLNYQLDRYFRPLKEMQGLTSGRESIASTKAVRENTVAGLESLREDIRGKKISNDDAARLLKRKIEDPEFRNYIDNAPYAERKELEKIFTGTPDSEDIINLLFRILGR